MVQVAQGVANIVGSGGAIGRIAEDLRQEAADDALFFATRPYFFELQTSAEVGGFFGNSFLFPLVLNPTSIEMDEPFAMQPTTTEGGGLFVEEHGIVQRIIRIEGHTGWRPRPYRGSDFGELVAPNRRSFNRDKAVASPVVPKLSLSGQRHFQFLQDAVFRTYADLKRDPNTSRETRLLFHNPKDSESWIVAPQRFMLRRRVEKRVLYEYTIELLAVDAGTLVDKDFSEDKSVIDSIKDVFRTLQSGIDLAQGVLRDLGNVVNVIEGVISGFTTLVSNTIGLLDATANFVNGVEDSITSTVRRVGNLADELDRGLDAIKDLDDFPDQVRNSLRQMRESFDRLLNHPDSFQTATNRALQNAQRNTELTTQRRRQALAEAAAEAAPNSFAAFIAKGTGLLPGAQQRADSELATNRALARYQSAFEHTLEGSDTLQSLSAQFLGDASLWRHIAQLNNLQAPYITDQGLPNTIKRGGKILIPSFAPAPDQTTLVPVLGVGADEPLENRLLGTDYKLVQLSKPGNFVDWEVDEEQGSLDLKLASGIDNLKQAMITRSDTEQGTDILYRRLGRKRILALSKGVDTEVIRFRIAEAIQADPRIASVRSVRLSDTDTPDVVEARIEAEVRGFRGTAPVVFRTRGV